jgi:hypothetical protein
MGKKLTLIEVVGSSFIYFPNYKCGIRIAWIYFAFKFKDEIINEYGLEKKCKK